MIRKRISALLLSAALLLPFMSHADEGMWLPMLVKRLNHAEMQKKGLKLTAEEIYSVNQASLKDAIVQLGGFCTGEFISKEGLLLTNHHCGYSAIQSHSTPQDDILKNGFWAQTRAAEKKNEGLFVDILVRMDDMTSQVLEGIDANTSDADRAKLTAERTKKLAAEASENGRYVTYVRDFFGGNEYYLFVYDRYNDVRLVGTPQESIGKFGGDTDNWMWPRHTGDFSMFRVYMAPDGSPSKEISDKNVPYKPKHHLPISMSGIQEGDFSMVFGFPGRTERYKASSGLALDLEQINPARIKLREKRLALMKEDMDKDQAIRIKYAATYAQISNYYKNFIGTNEGMNRLKTLDTKRADEKKFQAWADADPKRKALYGTALADIEAAYKGYQETNLSNVYLSEAALGSEVLSFALNFRALHDQMKNSAGNNEALKPIVEQLKAAAEAHFKDYNAPTDRKVTKAMLSMFKQDVPKAQQPDVFQTIDKKYKGNVDKFVDNMFDKSIFDEKDKVMAFLNNPNMKTLENDPAFQAIQSVYNNYITNISPKRMAYKTQLDRANRIYIAGLREMNPNKVYYPDANSTLRLSYGSVLDYEPRDGVLYNYYTTTDGILEKEDPNNPEFEVPAELISLIQKKDFGKYANEKGEMPVCFISNNDITGGNSGSPVINGRGELIGLAFDGNWEAMTGNLAFEPQLQRCINVDIRYVLWVVDKLAGAKHIINELDLVYAPNPKSAEAAAEEAKKAVPANLPAGTEMKIKSGDTKIKVETKKKK